MFPSGLDLAKIATDDVSRYEVTARVRKHIGSGILVSLEEDGIWLYNRSEVRITVILLDRVLNLLLFSTV